MTDLSKPNCPQLHQSFIEVLKAQGDFEKELSIFEQTRNLPNIKSIQSSLEQNISHLYELLSNVPPEWKELYKTEFNIDLSQTHIKIPEKREGFDRLIIIPQGLTLNKVYETLGKHFECEKYAEDLDKDIPHNDRTPTHTYAIWIRDRIEADKEHKNKSADQLKEHNIKGITLLERLILELKYYTETNQHLDMDNLTLCNGSHTIDGGVPGAGWRSIGGQLLVDWYGPGYSRDYLRAREVVS